MAKKVYRRPELQKKLTIASFILLAVYKNRLLRSQISAKVLAAKSEQTFSIVEQRKQ